MNPLLLPMARRMSAVLLLLVVSMGVAHHTNSWANAEAPPDASNSTSQRIVTLFQGATDSAVALGLTPVGVVESWLETPMYPYLRDALDGVEYVGLETQPNLEKVAWLSPDLVVATDFRHERIQPLLTRISTTVALPDVFDFKDTLAAVAEHTGRQEEAAILLQEWDTRVSDFRRQIADSLGSEWPQRVAVIRFKSDHVRIYSGGFSGDILDELGFEQPDTLSTHGWGMKLSSTENIPILDADVIFVLLEPNPAIADNYQRWASHPLWQQLDAVKSQRVFEVDPINWMMGGGILAANAMLDDLYRHYGLHQQPLAYSTQNQVCLATSFAVTQGITTGC